MNPHPDFQMAAATRFIYQALEAVPVGNTLSYEALSAAAGERVDGSHGGLQTAIRRLRRDKSMIFATVKGTGVRRLSDTEIVDLASVYQHRIRRAARRSFEINSKADFAALPREYQMKQSANASIMAAAMHMTTTSKIIELERRMPEGTRELPLNETLRLFQK